MADGDRRQVAAEGLVRLSHQAKELDHMHKLLETLIEQRSTEAELNKTLRDTQALLAKRKKQLEAERARLSVARAAAAQPLPVPAPAPDTLHSIVCTFE